MNVEIRAAGEADLPAILELYVEFDADRPPLSLDQARAIFRRLKRYPDYTIYVASRDGKIVGTFALLIMDNLAHQGAPLGLVENVVVPREWQRRGVGKEMMRFAMARCRARGCYKLCLSSNLKRRAAHRFYESLGFQKHGYSFMVGLKE